MLSEWSGSVACCQNGAVVRRVVRMERWCGMGCQNGGGGKKGGG